MQLLKIAIPTITTVVGSGLGTYAGEAVCGETSYSSFYGAAAGVTDWFSCNLPYDFAGILVGAVVGLSGGLILDNTF